MYNNNIVITTNTGFGINNEFGKVYTYIPTSQPDLIPINFENQCYIPISSTENCCTELCIDENTPPGCIVPDCTDVNVPYAGCNVPDCTGDIDIPYLGCNAATCTDVNEPYPSCIERTCFNNLDDFNNQDDSNNVICDPGSAPPLDTTVTGFNIEEITYYDIDPNSETDQTQCCVQSRTSNCDLTTGENCSMIDFKWIPVSYQQSMEDELTNCNQVCQSYNRTCNQVGQTTIGSTLDQSASDVDSENEFKYILNDQDFDCLETVVDTTRNIAHILQYTGTTGYSCRKQTASNTDDDQNVCSTEFTWSYPNSTYICSCDW